MPGASGRGFSAIVARTSTSHAPVEPRAYDCAEVTVVRSGAVILFGEFGHRHLNVGDVILLAPCALYGMEPEGWIAATTLHLDRDNHTRLHGYLDDVAPAEFEDAYHAASITHVLVGNQ